MQKRQQQSYHLREEDQLRELGLQDYEIQYLTHLKTKDKARDKWR